MLLLYHCNTSSLYVYLTIRQNRVAVDTVWVWLIAWALVYSEMQACSSSYMNSKAIISTMHSSYMIVSATYRCTRCALSICPVQSRVQVLQQPLWFPVINQMMFPWIVMYYLFFQSLKQIKVMRLTTYQIQGQIQYIYM